MAVSAFRSTSRRDFLSGSENQGSATTLPAGHGRTASYSDSSSRYLSDNASILDSNNYHDASSQRDSDQDSFCPSNRHISSDSESEASSIIDRFRQNGSRTTSGTSGTSATIPRFQQSTISARGRQRSIEPNRRSESRGPEGRYSRAASREPGIRRQGRSESKEPGDRRRSESKEPTSRYNRSESREPGPRRSESKEPVGRITRSESREPGLRRQERSESKEPVGRITRRESWESSLRQERSESKEPVGRITRGESWESSLRQERSESKEPVRRITRSESEDLTIPTSDNNDYQEDEPRGRISQRAEIVFTSSRKSRSELQEPVGSRPRRSESQEPRGRSHSTEPAAGRHRRSESQGPGPQRLSSLKHFSDLRTHSGSDFQDEERTITAVHSQLKHDPPAGDTDASNIYGAMRAEVRKAVADLKTEIEESLEKDVLALVKSKGGSTEPDIRKQYAEKLEQSENRTQELLSQLAKEEETRRELAKVIKGSPSSNKPEQKLKTRKEVKERETISKALDEEAQRYFEEFASISASETEDSSKKRSKPAKKPATQSNRKSPSKDIPRWKTGLVAVNTDGIVTPWLDWETDSADVRSFLALGDILTQLLNFQGTLPDINWDSLVASTSVTDYDSIRVSEELPVQRIRFRERIEAGRIHICKTEF